MSPGTAPARRGRFAEVALDQIGCPYIWDAKGELKEDPDSGVYQRCFDCSGLVTFSLWRASNEAIDWRATKNADRLFHELPPTSEPMLGDLAFYGLPEKATHVVIMLAGIGFIIGANGGASDVTSIPIAKARNARVKVDPRGENYRPGFLGFRSLSQFLST